MNCESEERDGSTPTSEFQPDQSLHNQHKTMRLAVVLRSDLNPGQACNAAAIATGGLRCNAFSAPITDMEGSEHVAIRWNLVVLRAKTASQLSGLLRTVVGTSVQFIVFSELGQTLHNSFDRYEQEVRNRTTDACGPVAVALYGADLEVRTLTKRFSLLQ